MSEKVVVRQDGSIEVAIRDEAFVIAPHPFDSTTVGSVSLRMAAEDASRALADELWKWPLAKRAAVLASLFERFDHEARRAALETLLLTGHDMERLVKGSKT